MDFVEGVGVFH